MKCFECGNKCLTIYYHGDRLWESGSGEKITHVAKGCFSCGWESYRTKIPEKI